MNKPHLFFKNPFEGVEKIRSRNRYHKNDKEEEDKIELKNFAPQREVFVYSRREYFRERVLRESKRNTKLSIPAKIEYIILEFFDYFNTVDFEIKYENDFGLSHVRFSDFNTKGLFAVINEDKFKDFFEEIEKFINSDDPLNNNSYNPNVRYIREFSFLSSDKIIQYQVPKEYFILELTDNNWLFNADIKDIRNSLLSYFNERNIPFNYDEIGNRIELFSVDEIIKEIADNFDIIHTINSPLAGTVKPSTFNLPIKTYGFAISNPTEDLPIIGIIDTGVSNQTPLAPLILNSNNEFNITRTNALTDNVDHGTGVAAFAALGNSFIPNHNGVFKADAKILSIKVLDSESGYITESEVIRLIRKAHTEHNVKIFVLTIGYEENKKINSQVSNYAYLLDLLAYSLDILIFISTGNHDNLSYWDGRKFVKYVYPKNFVVDKTILCSPADSMNNISCGAIAENFESFSSLKNLTPSRDYPASYTRKFYIDTSHPFFKNPRKNKQFLKPDVCYAGGDYNEQVSLGEQGIKILSSKPGYFYDRSIGSSYAAPLLANFAAKICQLYPKLKIQTVKALIINSTRLPNFGNLFSDITKLKPEFITGKGKPDLQSCLFSNDDEITLLLEDEITPGEFKSYPIKLPDYLFEIEKQNSIVTVQATLSFSFEPYSNDQLVYCPIHITFGIFKNLPMYLECINNEGKPDNIGINGGKSDNIKVRESWSQDYYFKPKLLSNCQKINFNLSKENLINEKGEFKIAVKCQLHKLLPAYKKNKYQKPQSYSLVISIKENRVRGENTGRLYNEMILINNLEAVTSAELELDTEV